MKSKKLYYMNKLHKFMDECIDEYIKIDNIKNKHEIVLYRGKSISEMSKKELIQIINELDNYYQSKINILKALNDKEIMNILYGKIRRK